MEKNNNPPQDKFEQLYNKIWRELDINHGDLRGESFKHPRVALYWHAVGIRAKQQVEGLEYQLTVLEATLRKEFRSQKEQEKGGKLKPREITSEMLDTYVTLHADVQALRRQLIEARAIAELLEGAKWRLRERFLSIGDQKGQQGEEADQLTRMHREYENQGRSEI